MRDPRARGRWVRAHAVLRTLLGHYTETHPLQLHLASNAHGKPQLAGELGAGEPRFSLSHSGALALCAFAADEEIGVDVELARRPRDEVSLAARTFGPAEAQRLLQLHPERRTSEFLRLWTRYEALLKCAGTGIGRAQQPAPGDRPWIAELDLGGRAAGAVALSAIPRRLLCLQWPGRAR